MNRIRNPDFRLGSTTPRHWVWRATDSAIRSARLEAENTPQACGIEVTSKASDGEGFWSQVVPCKPDAWYRVEATVSCDLSGGSESAGLILTIDPLVDGRPTGLKRSTPGLHRVAEPIAVRAYFHADDDVRHVEIAVGVVHAAGSARVLDVRFIRILEPDEMSHPLAVPSPASHYVPPRIVESLTVCSDLGVTRPVRSILAAYFGDSNVRAMGPSELDGRRLPPTDAILLPDAAPPKGVRSLAALLALAEERIVVVSLSAFAALNRRSLALRRIEQPDDPIHAKVVFSDHATRGFALHDVFPYAWAGREPGSFAQNHFRRTKAFKAFCLRHRFEVLLLSNCDKDATSDQPICLYHRTRNGGLFVLDIEPVESTSSTFGEPNLAAHFLLSIFGRHQATAGQFTAPVRLESHFREMIRETANRWEHFIVHDDDIPASDVTHQLITVGGDDQLFGLPLTPKPVVVIRSGLRGGDVESVYGVLSWVRQLLRPQPHPCPHANALASRFRLAWVPCAAPWESRDGWRRMNQEPTAPMEIESEDGSMAALIDVESRPAQRVRVVYARADAMFKTAAKWLPVLIDSFGAGDSFAYATEGGESSGDRSRMAWRKLRWAIQVVAESESFGDEAHRNALSAGANVVRIEAPGGDADFVANSITRTDIIVRLLEGVIGLHYGLIAINRGPASVQLDGFPLVPSGDALIVDQRDPILRSRFMQVG